MLNKYSQVITRPCTWELSPFHVNAVIFSPPGLRAQGRLLKEYLLEVIVLKSWVWRRVFFNSLTEDLPVEAERQMAPRTF